jgi:hypothetical protein
VVSLKPRPESHYAVLAIGFAFFAEVKGETPNFKSQIPIKLQLGKILKIKEEEEAEE